MIFLFFIWPIATTQNVISLYLIENESHHILCYQIEFVLDFMGKGCLIQKIKGEFLCE